MLYQFTQNNCSQRHSIVQQHCNNILSSCNLNAILFYHDAIGFHLFILTIFAWCSCSWLSMCMALYVPWNILLRYNSPEVKYKVDFIFKISILHIGYLKPSTVSTLWTPNEITTGKVSKSYPGDSYALGWTIHPDTNNQQYSVYHSGKCIIYHLGNFFRMYHSGNCLTCTSWTLKLHLHFIDFWQPPEKIIFEQLLKIWAVLSVHIFKEI